MQAIPYEDSSSFAEGCRVTIDIGQKVVKEK
jgi:hypothetical protein